MHIDLFEILLTKYPGQIVAVVERQNRPLNKLKLVATNNINDILACISSIYDDDPNYSKHIELGLNDLTILWINNHNKVKDSMTIYFSKEQGNYLFDLYTILIQNGLSIINPNDVKPILSNAEGRLYQILENKV